jgi:hypothetical protein
VEISLDSIIRDYAQLAMELSKTPLGAPLLFAAVWRARSGELSIQTVFMALVVPYVLVRIWPVYLPIIGQPLPSFLDFTQWQSRTNALSVQLQYLDPNWTPNGAASSEISGVAYYCYLILLTWTPNISIKNDIIKLAVITLMLGICLPAIC